MVAVQTGGCGWGDYDNDGDPDLLYAGSGAGGAEIRLYRNDGSGTFTDVTTTALTSATGVSRSNVAWGDFNNDGYLDFAVMGLTDAGSHLLDIYRNTGSGTFTVFQNLTPGVGLGALAWADINGSGYMSLLACGATAVNAPFNQTLLIFRNDGGTLFTSITAPAIGVKDADLAVADVDLDGDADFALMGRDTTDTRVLKIYRNNGSGSFSDNGQNHSGLDQGGLALGDVNNDGYPDLAIMGNNPRALRVHINNTSGGFETTASISLIGLDGGRVALCDYNADGKLDLAATGNYGADSIAKVYINVSNSYAETNANLTLTGAAVSSSSIAWADADSDGRPDIFVTGINGASALVGQLYLSSGVTANAAPSTPSSSFSSQLVGGVLTFQWGNGSDGESASGQLGYEIRIGTSSGGTQASSSVFGTPFTGSHYPSRISSTQPGRILQSFPLNKILYWSVRTIDQGFRVSSWSEEQAIYSGGSLTVSGGQGAHITKANVATIKSGIVKDPNGLAVSGVPVKFTITKPNGEVLTYQTTTGADGIATATVTADETTQAGIYLVSITGLNITLPSQSVSFVVAVQATAKITVAPNPFTPTKAPWNRAVFIASERSDVAAEIKIFEIGGALIRKIAVSAGDNAEWDGKDEAGNIVEGGIYLWQLSFGGKNLTGTVVVAR